MPPDTAPRDSLALTDRLLGLVTDSWIAQALYVGAKLGIPDLLKTGSKTTKELSESTGTHEPSLRRLMRALITVDICSEGPDGSFALTKLGGLLCSDAPDSLHFWTIYWGDHLWSLWAHLLESVQTGESARKLLAGDEGFSHLERDTELAAVFNNAMAELTRVISHDVARKYDFSGAGVVVDVGGGCGQLLIAILEAYPQLLGVVFDLPHTMDLARHCIGQAGLDSRCHFVAGDFFEAVPSGGDLYILNSVLHDWGQDHSTTILNNCRQSMNPKGRLLVIERIMPVSLESSNDHRMIARSDLTMLIGIGGQERTEEEFRLLLQGTGFRISRILPVGLAYSLIEAEAGDCGPGR